jgi:hypothetical protein
MRQHGESEESVRSLEIELILPMIGKRDSYFQAEVNIYGREKQNSQVCFICVRLRIACSCGIPDARVLLQCNDHTSASGGE